MPRKPDNLIGLKFGMLTVVEMIRDDKGKGVSWLCQCSCGKTTITKGTSLKSGKTKSCGCLNSKREDLSGQKFGMLTALYEDEQDKRKWVFKCDCGKTKSILKSNVKKGVTISCGCKHKKAVKEALKANLINKKFGKLTVVAEADNIITPNGKSHTAWKCICECGNECVVRTCCLSNGITTSCGCYKSEMASKRFSYKLEGMKFGRLLVLERDGSFTGTDGTKYSLWKCQCDCGTIKSIRGHDLVRGSVSSCGCLVSKGEESTREFLNELGVEFDTQYTFSDLLSSKGRALRFDFVIKRHGKVVGAIEYQGIQHFKEQPHDFGKQQREVTDIQKRKYCIENSIPLLEIRYDQDIKEEIKRFLKIINY